MKYNKWKPLWLFTTRKYKFNDGGIPRDFVVKEDLRRISEETRFVVTRSS